jgi:hypothetical protein
VTDEHVVRFEVAMHEPDRMRRREPRTRRAHHREDLAPRAHTRLAPLAQRHALDELHRDEDAIAERADIVHRDHVRMGQPRHRLRLSQQPGLAARRRRPRAARSGLEQLERDPTIELGIVGRIDDAHATLPDHIDDDVAADHGAALQRVRGLGRHFRQCADPFALGRHLVRHVVTHR